MIGLRNQDDMKLKASISTFIAIAFANLHILCTTGRPACHYRKQNRNLS